MTSDFCVAVHALEYLTHKRCTLSSEVLAGNICTNPARVRKVMASLGAAGLVTTREGADGGYCAVRSAHEVTLAELARALQVRFVGPGWHSGDPQQSCSVSSGMAKVMDVLFAGLDAACLDRLEKTTLADVDRQLFPAAAADETNGPGRPLSARPDA